MNFNSNKDIRENKTLLRTTMRQARRSLDEDTRFAAENALCQNILKTLDECSPRLHCVAVYLAKPPEASIDPVIRVLTSRSVSLCAPRESDFGPQFVALNSLDDVKINSRGVREPKYETVLVPQEINAILVPGLAFDVYGARLGQGGGWYDRVLQTAHHALKIGVCFDLQIVENVPQEQHDIRMDFVVTESRVIRVSTL